MSNLARTNLELCQTIIEEADLRHEVFQNETGLSAEQSSRLMGAFENCVNDPYRFQVSVRRTLQKITSDIETTKEAIAVWKSGGNFVRSQFPSLKSMERHLGELLNRRHVMTFVADFMSEKLTDVKVTTARLRSILTSERITRGERERERQPSLM